MLGRGSSSIWGSGSVGFGRARVCTAAVTYAAVGVELDFDLFNKEVE